jgi:hypothetical protein
MVLDIVVIRPPESLHALMSAPPRSVSAKPSMACAPLVNWNMSPAASSPAAPSAAASVTGAAPRAISTKSRRSPSRGPMRLHLCDMALERARLAFARIEAFAPLNGLIDDSPPKPAPPRVEERAKLAEEARANLATARELIERCGYHRRDEELAELEAVRDGRRRFADLPPRV